MLPGPNILLGPRISSLLNLCEKKKILDIVLAGPPTCTREPIKMTTFAFSSERILSIYLIQHPNYFSKANYLIYKKLKNKIIFLGKKTNYFGLQELFYIKMYV